VITHVLIHTFQPKCRSRGGQQGSGDFYNEVLEYHSLVHEERAWIAIACSFTEGRRNLSLSLSFSRIRATTRKKLSIRTIPMSRKFAESNFNSGATAEIRFDIRRRNVRNESANSDGKAGVSLFPSNSSLILSRRANPDYSVNDAIRRIISVRTLSHFSKLENWIPPFH